jgi:hypothetical protein
MPPILVTCLRNRYLLAQPFEPQYGYSPVRVKSWFSNLEKVLAVCRVDEVLSQQAFERDQEPDRLDC